MRHSERFGNKKKLGESDCFYQVFFIGKEGPWGGGW